MGSMQDHQDKIDRARRAFRTQFRAGDSFTMPHADIETHDIDVTHFDPTRPDTDYVAWHGGMIQVHGDKNLRDRLAIELNSEPNGYAVNTPGDGGIDMRTVGPTRRSAIVNWLYVSRGWAITNTWTDDMIEQAWRSSRRYKIDGRADMVTAYCIKVVVHSYQLGAADVSDGENANVA